MALNKLELERFDIVSYFKHRNIKYWTGGRNVQRGWINTTCLFCGDHAYSGNNHLGIDLKTKLYNCWICREKGAATKLVALIEKCSYSEAESIIKEFKGEIPNTSDTEDYYKHKKIEGRHKSVLPKECSDKFLDLHLNYLRFRNFDPYFLIKKYSLKATHNIGEYKFRIIAPVFINNKIVTFATRDVTNKSNQPHKNCPDNQSIIPISNTIYNIHTVKDKMVLVEGLADVWNMGDGFTSSYGYILSQEQIILIKNSGIKSFFVLLDAEARADWISDRFIAGYIAPFVNHTEVIYLDNEDPAKMSSKDVVNLRRDIGL